MRNEEMTTLINLDDEKKKGLLEKLRQFFCRHDWMKDFGQPVHIKIRTYGRLLKCRKCGKEWTHPSIRPIYIRWWDRLFIRLGLLQFIDPILRHDIEMDPEMKDDLPSWTLR